MKNISIKLKLITAFSFILVFAMGFGVYALRSIYVMYERVEEANEWAVGFSQLAQIQKDTDEVRRHDLSYILRRGAEAREKILKDKGLAVERANKMLAVYKRDIETLDYDTEEQRAQDMAFVVAIITHWEEYLRQSGLIFDSLKAGDEEKATDILNNSSSSAFSSLEASIKALEDFNDESCAAVVEMGKVIFANNKIRFLCALAALCVVLLVIPFYLARIITRSIEELMKAAEAIGNGDLSVRSSIESKDEFGTLSRHYNSMTEHLKELVLRIQGLAGQISVSAGEFNASASQSDKNTEAISREIATVSERTKNQSAEVESIAGLIREITGNIAEISNDIDALAAGSKHSAEKAAEGGVSMKNAVEQMSAIEGAVGNLTNVVTSLSGRAVEISRFVETIAGISKQTNLLALNAAIEAARAGDQGRGFAVVADEVKNLAGDSRSATEEIARLIEAIQEEIAKATSAMEASGNEVKKGALAVSSGTAAFNVLAEISNASSKQIEQVSSVMRVITDKTASMSTAASNLEDESNGITRDVLSIASASEEQSASNSEISKNADSLTGMSIDMLKSTQRFVLE
ncbi:hypothetical protein FACS1894204_12720 [Synergistales bacterium]|nr:hypothetical protein FACS1894204_12720 [Synergistales bacterium]